MKSTYKIALAGALAVTTLAATPAALAKTTVGGRIMVDVVQATNDEVTSGGTTNEANNIESGTEFRRARIFVESTVADEVKAKLQLDFAKGDGGDNNAVIKDGYLQWSPRGLFDLFVGQSKMPGGLNNMTSSKYIQLMERSSISDLFASHRIGGKAQWSNPLVTLQAGVFGQNYQVEESDNEGFGASVRGAIRPINTDSATLHLGATIGTEEPSDAGKDAGFSRVRVRPGVHLAKRIFDVSFSAKHMTYFAGEAAFLSGPFSVQGELGSWRFDVEGGGDKPEITAGYVQGGYFVFGGHRTYKTSAATFNRPKITGNNALELAARIDHIKAEEGTDESEQTAFTIGGSWYFNKATRLMLNYVVAKAEDKAAGVTTEERDVGAVAARMQIDFK